MGKLRCKAAGWVGAGREESQQWGCKQRECVCFEGHLKAPGPRAGLVLKSGFAPPCEIVEGLEGSLGGCRGRFSPRVLCALHQLRSFFGWLFFFLRPAGHPSADRRDENELSSSAEEKFTERDGGKAKGN